MKKLALFLITAIACMACTKQAEKQQTTPIEEVVMAEETDEVATEPLEEALPVAEQMPEFPGGMGELMKYLGENIQYPTKAQDNHWEGVAVCQFIVEKDGSINEAKILQSSGYQLLDVEALRVVLNMPKWTAGMQNGDSVRVQFALPISFKLQ
ncbi:MAG: energy transducer TonB [Paludibacteraceae bacterium]|nr:energy transducer TonB [Paludibacteraceae bacterium]